MAERTMIESISHALDQEMARDESVMVLGEDVGRDGGIFRATDGLLDKYGEERVVDTPIAESAIVGTSIGLAINGMRPVCELQFDGFSYQAFHQVESHVARFRKRTNGAMTVPMVIRFPIGAGVRALEHHSEAPEIFYTHIPGIKVVVPRGPKTCWELLKRSVRDPDPVVFMEPKALYRKFREDVPDEDDGVKDSLAGVGCEIVKGGDDVTLVSYGHMLYRSLETATKLEEQGVSAEVIDVQMLAPLDARPILSSVRKTGRCVVVTESKRSYGWANEIVARINEDALLHLEAPVQRITGYDVHVPLLAREEAFMPHEERIRTGVEATIKF